jgi:aerobic carbon-monoxide dehydrogenase large subunit
METAVSILGSRVVRTEDPRLLTEGGVYLDDVRVPGLAGAARVTFVRSPLAHARITGIDASAARNEPGVLAVLTAADIAGAVPADKPRAEPLLATDRVRYAGEPVAMVLTTDLYQGEDAAELVIVDYDPLPAVVDLTEALAGEVLLFDGTDSNVAGTGVAGNCEPADFDACAVVVERTIVNQRLAPVPLETRGAAARWADGRLTVWASTQNAQLARDALVKRLGLDKAAVRVIAPDVGGGFGAKVSIDRDSIAVAWAAHHTGHPLRWAETRSENLVGMVHGRGQRQTVKIGGSRDGRIHAYHLRIVQDCGAYPRVGASLPTLTQLMASGVYDLAHSGSEYRSVLTTTTPVAAYRGAGRPEAAAAIERAVDLFAAEIGLDPAEVRRRNFVPPDRFPYTTPTGAVYDTGNYRAALDTVLSVAGYRSLRAEQAARRASGDPRQLGIGLSCYVEITASDGADGETARLTVDSSGAVTVYTGSSPQGQGHATAWAMLVQEELGIPMERVTVLHGDTDAIPEGVGTFGSRSLQLGGLAVRQAAIEVRDRARRLAADLLEASEADLELDPGRGEWQVRGDPATARGWAELATLAGPDGLSADVRYTTDQPTFPFGAHLALVEVDVETGKVTLLRHVTVDDAGTVVNPVLAEGQRHGGIAQGVAQALLEEVRYDADGNPLTATLADYAAITATELPSFELAASETPTTVNSLGVKGIGEAGTIGATPAVQNAVVDAVSHLGVGHIDMPATPHRVWAAIAGAAAG